MNTISPPPQIRRISAPKRVLGVVVGIAGGLGANALLGYGFMSFYTRGTKFVPYDNLSPDHSTPVFKAHNPSSNPAVCIDHAVKEIPYGKLPEKYFRRKDGGGEGGGVLGSVGKLVGKVKGGKEDGMINKELLVTDFCRGIWSGVAYRVQRRYLERKYRALPGRETSLWDVKDLERSEYPVGTSITDHFEVLQHDSSKVIVRCGDSPLNKDHRPSDGLFSMEVSTDDEKQIATFHLKSNFVDTTPQGKDNQPLPWNFQLAHRWYTKLWMESATRKVLKDA